MHVCVLSCFSGIRFFVTLWTVALQALLSYESPGRNIGVGCCALLQVIFPTQGLNLCLFMTFSLAGRFFTTSTTWKAQKSCTTI